MKAAGSETTKPTRPNQMSEAIEAPETPYKYELLTVKTVWEDALIAFHESFDDAENYTEPGDLKENDDGTFSVFFFSEKPIDTDAEPRVR